MQITVRRGYSGNDFTQMWRTDEGGHLACAHDHVMHEPAQRGGSLEQSWPAYTYCLDCGKTLEESEPDFDRAWKERDE